MNNSKRPKDQTLREEKKPNLDQLAGAILPRSQPPRKLPTPKTELAAGQLLGKDTTEIIAFCIRCNAALMVIYPIEILSPFSTYQRPAKSLGPWPAPKRPNEPCPKCGAMWAEYNSKTNAAKYKTSVGSC